MSTQIPVNYTPSGSGPTYWGPGDQIRFIVTGEQTGGAFFLAEVTVPTGGGPPPHIQTREEESFYILEGSITFRIGDQTIQAKPGDFALVPRGAVHTFKNESQGTARMLVMCTPAGSEGFFKETFTPEADCVAGPPQVTEELMGRFMAAAAKYGIEFPRPG